MKRSLTLKRESLAGLADAELDGVVGGQYTVIGLSCPIGVCVRTLPLDHCVRTLPRDCIYATLESC